VNNIAFIGQRGTGKTTELVKWVIAQVQQGKRHIAFFSTSAYAYFDYVADMLKQEVGVFQQHVVVHKQMQCVRIAICTVQFHFTTSNSSRFSGFGFDKFDAIAIDEYEFFLHRVPQWVQYGLKDKIGVPVAISFNLDADTNIAQMVRDLPLDTSIQYLEIPHNVVFRGRKRVLADA
jgi:thymidine kinase